MGFPAPRRTWIRRLGALLVLSILLLSGGSYRKGTGGHGLWIPGAAAEGPRVAVIPFRQRNGGDEWRWLSEALPDLVGEALAVSGQYRLYERGHLGALLQERELARFGLLEEQGSAAAASAIDEAITGSFEIVEGRVKVVLRRIRVSDGSQLQSVTAERPVAEAMSLAHELAAHLLEGKVSSPLWEAPTRNLDAAKELYDGLSILRRGDLPGALFKIRKARSLSPAFPAARLWEGRIYMDMSEDRLADATLRKCLDAPPAVRHPAMRLLALLEISHGRSDEAAEYLEAYLRSAQETGDAADRRQWSFVELGRIRLSQGDPERAFDALRQAASLEAVADTTYAFPEATTVNRGGARAVFYNAASRSHTNPRDRIFALLHTAAAAIIQNGGHPLVSGVVTISDTDPVFERTSSMRPQPLAVRHLNFVRGNDDLFTQGAAPGEGEVYAFAAPDGKRIAGFTITQSAPLESREYEHVIEPYQYPGFVRTGMVRVGGLDDPFAYPEHFLPADISVETRGSIIRIRKEYRLPSDIRSLVLEAVMDQAARPTDWSVRFALADNASSVDAARPTGHLSFYTAPKEARCFIGSDELTKELYFGERDLLAGTYEARLESNGKVQSRTIEIAARRRSYLYFSPWTELSTPRVLAPGRIGRISQACDPDGPRLIVYTVEEAGSSVLHVLHPDSPSSTFRFPFSRDATDISPSLVFGPDFQFHLAWVRAASGADSSQVGVWYSQSSDGFQWTPARRIFEMRPSNLDLHVTDKGTFHLALVRHDPATLYSSTDRILLSRSVDGIRWSAPAEIALGPGQAHRPRPAQGLIPLGDVALTSGAGENVLLAANLLSVDGGQKVAIHSIEMNGDARFLSFVNDDPKYPVQSVRLRRGRDRGLYCAWKSVGPLMVARSDDEGRTWSHWLLAVPFLFGSPFWSDFRETDDGLEILWNAQREEGLWTATLMRPDFEGAAP